MADVSKALKIVRELNPLGLFSKATEAAANLPQAKGTGEQMRKMLVDSKGVKADELKYTGFDDWIKGKKSVTRDEMVEFLRRNQVQVGETRLGGANPYPYTTSDEWQRAINRAERQGNFDEAERLTLAWEAREGVGPGGAAKFEQYTLPGGKNYREVLLTADQRARAERGLRAQYADQLSSIEQQIKSANDEMQALWGKRPRTDEEDKRIYDLRDQLRDLGRQRGVINATIEKGVGDVDYRSSHWDEPNVLAHLRLSDRYDPQGRKILHVEEIQSDWAQEGRKKGFVLGGDEAQALRAERDRLAATPREQRTPEISQRIIDINGQLGDQGSRIPSAPFVESTPKWTDLALKRALTEAAGGDYAGIAWTPGREQAKRYDLSKQIDSINYGLSNDGKTVSLEAVKDGSNVFNRANMPVGELEGLVGKEVADRILKGAGEVDPNTGYRSLSGLDLQVGGQGMIGYYDKIVPTQLQKLTQPLDPQARIGTVDVPTTTGGKRVGDLTDAELAWELNPAHNTPATTPQSVQLPFLEMTPTMREKIKEGLPLFTMMPAAVGLGATASQMQEGQNPAVEEQGFDKGGMVKKAVDLSRRVMGYSDPPSKRIEDWKWRPLADVAQDLNVDKIPPHVQRFGDYMLEMADKAKRGEISDRDLIKGYTTTRASIQRQAVDADKLRALGLDLPSDVNRIRPEGAWAEWLMTPMGQRYLDAASKGTLEGDAVASAIKIMSPFGRHETDIPDAMRWAAENLPGREARASELIARAAEGASSPVEWRQFTSDIRGVGPSKSGFLASLYGRGDQPTLDARQIILNTGAPTKEAGKYIARGRGEGGVEAVERLAARQSALDLEAPAKYDPFYQHLAHHTIWDKASGETTTHADIMNAMRNAAIVLGIPAAGAAMMEEGAEPRERAAGGRLLEDQYPTHYLPNVGRQVMADGGEPTAQARRRATLDELGAFEDKPVMDPETMGQNWASAVQRFRERPLREGETVARPLELGARDVIGGAIAGDGGTVRGRVADVLVGSKGLPESGTLGFGVLDAPMVTGVPLQVADISDAASKGDYTSALLGAALPAAFYARKPIMAAGRAAYDAGRRAVDTARDVLGRVPAPVAAGAAGAVAMTPEEAEAAKFRAPKGVTQILAGTPENTAINAREALKRVVSPFSEDPESVKRALEIAATYRVPQGAEFGTGSYFRTKPSMKVTDVRPDIAPLPNVTPLVPRQMSWEDFANEAKGGTLINVGGDRMNLGLLRDINNEKRLAWDVPLHAGPKYMLEPNPGLVWANAPGHTTSFNRIVSEAAEKGPVYGVYAPMGPTAVDSSVDMFNAVMAQLPTSKITKKAAKEFDDFVKSGAFVQKVEDRPRMAETMKTLWPGIQKLKDPESVAKLADQLSGVHRGDLIKAMEKAKWRKEGFPEIGVTRVAVTDPALLSAPSNTIGHRIVRFDTENLITPERRFAHPTYPTESVGQYVADVPLVQTQYGMPTALERILSKPTKSGEVMHPYSIDPLGRSSARKMFTEQKQVQPVDDQLIESIMLGLQRQKEYGFRRGGGVSHYAMMLAKEIGSSPRETVTP